MKLPPLGRVSLSDYAEGERTFENKEDLLRAVYWMKLMGQKLTFGKWTIRGVEA